MPHLTRDAYPNCIYKMIENGHELPQTCAECGYGGCKTWRPYMGMGCNRLPSIADVESALKMAAAAPQTKGII